MEEKRLKKLIEFFKTLGGPLRDGDKKKITGPAQTEEAYQKEQAEWLKTVRQKRKQKQ